MSDARPWHSLMMTDGGVYELAYSQNVINAFKTNPKVMKAFIDALNIKQGREDYFRLAPLFKALNNAKITYNASAYGHSLTQVVYNVSSNNPTNRSTLYAPNTFCALLVQSTGEALKWDASEVSWDGTIRSDATGSVSGLPDSPGEYWFTRSANQVIFVSDTSKIYHHKDSSGGGVIKISRIDS